MESKDNRTATAPSPLCDEATGVCSPTGAAISRGEDEALHNEKKADVKLVYYYDALCGWCYGFSPVMSKIKEVYGDRLAIEVVSGGLFLGMRAGAINEVAPHIKAGAYKSVTSRTGVEFGKAFLEVVFGEGNMTLDSLPPTMALNIVREVFPERALDFAALLLQAVYFDGLDPVDVEGLSTCAATIGFDKKAFLVKMSDAKYKRLVEQDVEVFRNSQYAAMPALVLVKAGKEYPIARGYTDFENIAPKLEVLLA